MDRPVIMVWDGDVLVHPWERRPNVANVSAGMHIEFIDKRTGEMFEFRVIRWPNKWTRLEPVCDPQYRRGCPQFKAFRYPIGEIPIALVFDGRMHNYTAIRAYRP